MLKKYNILMDGDKPRGGKWSYDSENRKKLPKNFQVPNIPQIQETNHTKILKSRKVTDFSSKKIFFVKKYCVRR